MQPNLGKSTVDQKIKNIESKKWLKVLLSIYNLINIACISLFYTSLFAFPYPILSNGINLVLALSTIYILLNHLNNRFKYVMRNLGISVLILIFNPIIWFIGYPGIIYWILITVLLYSFSIWLEYSLEKLKREVK